MTITHTVLYVIGPPGVGKSTLVRHLLGFKSFDCRSNLYDVAPPGTKLLKPKWTTTPGGMCASGHYEGKAFDGGDTVPYNGGKDCLDYWVRELFPVCPLTILDGDRFSNQPALDFLHAHNAVLVQPKIRVMGVHLVAGPELLAARRSERGSNQNAIWMKGRETKAKNFAAKLPLCHELDASFSTESLSGRVRTILGDLDV